jgi:hypothetical protein
LFSTNKPHFSGLSFGIKFITNPISEYKGTPYQNIFSNCVANEGSNNVSVLLNTGNGTFLSQDTYSTGARPHSVAVVDVNSDNKPDIVVANWGSNNTGVLLHC